MKQVKIEIICRDGQAPTKEQVSIMYSHLDRNYSETVKAERYYWEHSFQLNEDGLEVPVSHFSIYRDLI